MEIMDTSILEHYKFVREQRSKLEIENAKLTGVCAYRYSSNCK